MCSGLVAITNEDGSIIHVGFGSHYDLYTKYDIELPYGNAPGWYEAECLLRGGPIKVDRKGKITGGAIHYKIGMSREAKAIVKNKFRKILKSHTTLRRTFEEYGQYDQYSIKDLLIAQGQTLFRSFENSASVAIYNMYLHKIQINKDNIAKNGKKLFALLARSTKEINAEISNIFTPIPLFSNFGEAYSCDVERLIGKIIRLKGSLTEEQKKVFITKINRRSRQIRKNIDTLTKEQDELKITSRSIIDRECALFLAELMKIKAFRSRNWK